MKNESLNNDVNQIKNVVSIYEKENNTLRDKI